VVVRLIRPDGGALLPRFLLPARHAFSRGDD
jgi:hypothetical protein